MLNTALNSHQKELFFKVVLRKYLTKMVKEESNHVFTLLCSCSYRKQWEIFDQQKISTLVYGSTQYSYHIGRVIGLRGRRERGKEWICTEKRFSEPSEGRVSEHNWKTKENSREKVWILPGTLIGELLNQHKLQKYPSVLCM